MIGENYKKCFKCGEVKPLSDFYKHPRMRDGTVNKCKECNKQDVRNNREANSDYYNEYDRQRGRNRDSERYRKKLEYGKRKDVRERHRICGENYYNRFPERIRAQSKVSNAIRDNVISRPDYCEYCGKECKPQAHHSSYAEDMWLVVTWLCTACHGEVHREYD